MIYANKEEQKTLRPIKINMPKERIIKNIKTEIFENTHLFNELINSMGHTYKNNLSTKIMQFIERNEEKTLSQTDTEGWGLIHYAASKNKDIILNELFKKGVNPNQQTKDGTTSLRVAIDMNSEEAIKLILSQPEIDIYRKDIYGNDFHLSIRHSRSITLNTLEMIDAHLISLLSDIKNNNAEDIEAVNIINKSRKLVEELAAPFKEKESTKKIKAKAKSESEKINNDINKKVNEEFQKKK